MKKHLEKIIGKRVTGVVRKAGGQGSYYRSQVFILFSDNTYCELYSGSLIDIANIYEGGVDDVRGYMSEDYQIIEEAYGA